MKISLLPMRHWLLAALLPLAASALWGCGQTTFQRQLSEHQDQLKQIDEDTIQSYLRRNNLLNKATRTNSGLYVVDLVNGTGAAVQAGSKVSVKYVGKFLSSGAHPASYNYPASFGDPRYPQGTIFDNSADNRSDCGCAVFVAGSGLTAGFSEGLLLSRVGDRKLFLVPSRLAYGPSGATGIPTDAALLFDVEILGIL